MKPHIKVNANGFWMCWSGDSIHFGTTPASAYRAWARHHTIERRL